MSLDFAVEKYRRMANVAIQRNRFVVLHFQVLNTKNRNYYAQSTLSDTIVHQFLPLKCIRSMCYEQKEMPAASGVCATLARHHLQTHIILLSGAVASQFPICGDFECTLCKLCVHSVCMAFVPSTRSAHNKNITDLFWNRTAATNN